jgi:sarcosine oxidase subunit gamma
MAEPVSALEGCLAPRSHGPGTPGIAFGERRIGALWQVAAWPDRLAEAGNAAAGAAGVATPPGPGQSAAGASAAILRVEPLKWWVLADAALPRPEIAPGDGTVLDLGHARTAIRIEGAALPELMARLVPLDLRPGRFPDGSVASTGLHHVGVTLLARAGGVDLFVPRSFARSLFEHVAEIAAQFGVEIG